jgi:hypothetical protein
MATKRKIVLSDDEQYAADYMAMADQEYIEKCIWTKKIEKRHCESVIDSAKNLIDYIDCVKNSPDEANGTLAYVSNFENAMHEHELTRRRQVRALQYLVQTKIL